jgi:NAD(P)-dependent dehydrogenase (short-subunit alcohol dehydrogenase family)
VRSIEEGISGKTAIITGGTMGIGKAICKVFAWAGANIVTCGRSVDLGNEVAKELTGKGPGKCMYLECDVSDTDRIKEVVEFTAKQFGGIDILVNCAGYFPLQRPIDETSIKEFDDIIAVNLRAYFAFCKHALPYLRTAKGNIINIGSVLGTTGDEGAAMYCATKGGITCMSKSLAVDEARNGVRVNEVKPGHIINEMFEKTVSRQKDPKAFIEYNDTVQWMGRGGTSEEVGQAVLFLASEWASFITGAELMVTGGFEFGEGTKKPLFNWATMEKK